MRAQIIQNDDLPCLKTWCKNVFNGEFKRSGIRRAFQDERFAHPGASESAANRVILARLLRGTAP
jgi:hypothetical protein